MINENSYEQGLRTAQTKMLAACCRSLGYDDPETSKASWILEREGFISALRSACEDYGDKNWDNNLHLVDVIEKHLMRHLQERDDQNKGLKK